MSLFTFLFPTSIFPFFFLFFFFNDTATTEIYTLSLHDALPISGVTWFILKDKETPILRNPIDFIGLLLLSIGVRRDRKSTRLNSSHPSISYAVFCLKKKKTTKNNK